MREFKNTGYYVTSDGNVIGKKGSIIKPNLVKGYGYVTIYQGSRENRKNYSLHRMVADLYIPQPEGKTQVNHINGIKTDNRVSNLEWTSAKENTQHAIKTGLRRDKGENSKNSVLTNQQAKQIRKEYVRGSSTHGQHGLAKKYNTTRGTIYNIINERTYTNA